LGSSTDSVVGTGALLDDLAGFNGFGACCGGWAIATCAGSSPTVTRTTIPVTTARTLTSGHL
jgi:hypothetical protein